MRNPCRECGRDTGDRHHVCWRCRRGLSIRLLDEYVERDHTPVKRTIGVECRCPTPRPQFIRLFGGYQCAKCGYPIHPHEATRGPQEAL